MFVFFAKFQQILFANVQYLLKMVLKLNLDKKQEDKFVLFFSFQEQFWISQNHFVI